MRELALHVLDIAENSVEAGATQVQITVEENTRDDRLKIVVEDNGRGMDEQLLARVTDPFVTTRTTRKVGLGIPLLKAAAEACNGSLWITSAPGQGTRLEAEFQRSHIDRMPLGDLAGTLFTLVIAYPNVHWILRYRIDHAEFIFDDEPIKKELQDIPLTEPFVLAFIREYLQRGISNVQEALASPELAHT
ncbi:MAG: ATP-binding protein [Anaerolineae bacterium]|nr:ATP-binding protein [Anaerolineae bacterium]MDW8099894.1 ATP-binding protein [Anaerolineae bacterium]